MATIYTLGADDTLTASLWTPGNLAPLTAALALGGTFQPADTDLTAIAALTTTAYGRSTLELVGAPAARILFGVPATADVLLKADNLLGVADVPAARTSLGLGSVEDTALSTWVGSAALTTLSSGTVTGGNFVGTTFSGDGAALTKVAKASGLGTVDIISVVDPSSGGNAALITGVAGGDVFFNIGDALNSGIATDTSFGHAANGTLAGAAVGFQANGSDYGAAIGRLSNGSVMGAAVGFQSNGSVAGAAVGDSANGSSYGAAVGRQSNGSSNGAALGANADGNLYGAATGYYADGNTSGAAVGSFAVGSSWGAAIGAYASGNNYGAAVGNQAQGQGYGAAVGYQSNGATSGAAVGVQAIGNNNGVAIGAYTNGDGIGNVAIGGSDSPTTAARITMGGFSDTIQLGRGDATVSGGLHFRSFNVLSAAGILNAGRFPAVLPVASGVNLTNLDASDLATGTVHEDRLGTAGTRSSTTFLRGDNTWNTAVTSVGLALPSFLTVSALPVTSSGTLTAVLASQAQRSFLVGPAVGAGVPTFRVPTLDELAAPIAPVAMGNQRITGLVDGVDPQDAGTVAQIEAARRGARPKIAVEAAADVNINIASPASATFDTTVVVANGERVLLPVQTTVIDRGIYIFNGVGVAMVRANDADTFAKIDGGTETFVQGGTVNGGKLWRQITELTSFASQSWTAVAAAVTYTAGSGLTESPAGTFILNPAITATTVNGLAITATTGTLGLANGSTLSTVGAFSTILRSTAATDATLPAGITTLLATNGIGTGLTALDAANLALGTTVADARLTTNVSLFGNPSSTALQVLRRAASGPGYEFANHTGVIQSLSVPYSTSVAITAPIPVTDIVPIRSQGIEILSRTITPTSLNSKIRVRVVGFGSATASNKSLVWAIFNSPLTDAPAVHAGAISPGTDVQSFAGEWVSGTVNSLAEITITLRVGPNTGSGASIQLNGSATARYFGGTAATRLIVEEIL